MLIAETGKSEATDTFLITAAEGSSLEVFIAGCSSEVEAFDEVASAVAGDAKLLVSDAETTGAFVAAVEAAAAAVADAPAMALTGMASCAGAVAEEEVEA